MRRAGARAAIRRGAATGTTSLSRVVECGSSPSHLFLRRRRPGAPLTEARMYAAPIDRRDFLRRTAALGASLPFAGLAWRAAAQSTDLVGDGFSSTTRI